jgi:hypothetical protein
MLKNNLNFHWFAVHSDNRVKDKHFISIIAIIINYYIYNIMSIKIFIKII